MADKTITQLAEVTIASKTLVIPVVDPTQLVENRNKKITLLNLLAPPAWANLTLQGGWAWSNVAGYATPQYRKSIDGIVELKGVISKATTPVANEVITVLPVDCRPTQGRRQLISCDGTPGVAVVDVWTDGSIYFVSGGKSFLSLEIRFSI